MQLALEKHELVTIPAASTIADGIAVRRAGEVTFPLVAKYVDEIVTVEEEEIASAILTLLEREKTLAEGAGAAGIAALLQHKTSLNGQHTAVIIGGGNIDVSLLSRIIERGLVKDGRLVRIRVYLPDRPGALADLSSALGRVPRAPLWKGQVLLTEGLADRPATFHTGLALPAGMRAVALPLSAAQAVGGTVVPGVLVDVLAVPIAGRAPAGRPTEILAQAALLLDVRSETGAAFGPQSSKAGLATVSERIGSVVIAIDRAEEIRFADRIATSTFVLTLVPSR